MTMRDDDNRPRVQTRETGFGWGIPAAIAAGVLIIAGLFYFNSGDTRSTTASTDRPAVTQPGPAGSQAPAQTPTTTPAPAPTTTPAPKQ